MTDALIIAGVILASLALVAVGLVMAATVRPSRTVLPRPHRDAFRRGQATPRQRRLAVVVNPTKVDDLADVERRLTAVARELDWAAPAFLTTSVEDPGTGQARAALADGADLIATLGGDGTVRAVAAALAGTDTPLALLPGGTGNLLARNLGLGIDDVDAALRLALTGRNRTVDVGYIRLDPADEVGDLGPDRGPVPESAADATVVTGTATSTGTAPTTDASAAADTAPTTGTAAGPADGHVFLVMAGLGLDATIMAETSEEAKARRGQHAYVATGLRNFLGPRFRAEVAVDGGQSARTYARTILIGNCGRITGGIDLMPDALVDDGLLDCVVLAPKGVAGWVLVSARLLTRNRKAQGDRLARHTGERFDIRTDQPEEVQLDGDVIGTARHVLATVTQRALVVRVGP